MKTVRDLSWSRRGFALFWGPSVLTKVAKLEEIVSVRELIQLSSAWPDRLPSAGGNTLVVAGLETCIDVLDPSDAKSWLDDVLKKVILSFQDNYEGQAGLVLWIAGGAHRIQPHVPTGTYHWVCHPRQESIPLGRILFSGSEQDVRRILNPDDLTSEPESPSWIGLHHPRIS